MYNHHERFFGRVAYWVMVLWSNQNFSVQTTLGTRPGLGNQTFYKIPSDQWLTSGERGCSLDNGPKVNHITAKWQIKQKSLRTYVRHIESSPQ